MLNASETLAGRVAVLPLYPLSLQEITAHSRKRLNRAQILDFLWRGGYPEIHVKRIDPKRFYADYTATYIERDLRQIVNVRDLRQFNRFMRLCASRIGQLVSASALAIDTGITVNTAQAWLSALDASGIIMLLPPYFRNLGKRIVKAPKLYFADTGLASLQPGLSAIFIFTATIRVVRSISSMHEAIAFTLPNASWPKIRKQGFRALPKLKNWRQPRFSPGPSSLRPMRLLSQRAAAPVLPTYWISTTGKADYAGRGINQVGDVKPRRSQSFAKLRKNSQVLPLRNSASFAVDPGPTR